MLFPVDRMYIKKAEEALGVEFPSSFTLKMMKDNGGDVETDEDSWQLFPFYDESDKKRVGRTFNDIIRETESARKWPYFPADCVAIASNGSGDYLVFKRSADSADKLDDAVYCWSHESGELEIAASSFSELI